MFSCKKQVVGCFVLQRWQASEQENGTQYWFSSWPRGIFQPEFFDWVLVKLLEFQFGSIIKDFFRSFSCPNSWEYSTYFFEGVKVSKSEKMLLRRLHIFFKTIKVNRVWMVVFRLSTSNYTPKKEQYSSKTKFWKSGAKEGGLNAHEEWRWQTVTAHAEIFFVCGDDLYSLDNLMIQSSPLFFQLGPYIMSVKRPLHNGINFSPETFSIKFFLLETQLHIRRLAGFWSLPNTIWMADKHLKDQKRSQKCWW